MRQRDWDPGVYDSTHHYVADYGKSLVELLAPQPGEHVLDLGCGTGHLTHRISEHGARVLGVDSSPSMVAQARQNYPKLAFQLADAVRFQPPRPFDAVFSNAALHWIHPPELAVSAIAASLRPGGRLVAEFGGRGNVVSITEAAGVNPWFFPSIGEYASLLERYSLSVDSAVLYDRPTKVEGEHGLRDWLSMFLPALPRVDQDRLAHELKPRLFHEGNWHIDYRRLRITATRGT